MNNIKNAEVEEILLETDQNIETLLDEIAIIRARLNEHLKTVRAQLQDS